MRNLTCLPEESSDLDRLTELNLSRTGVTFLPTSIGLLRNLEILHLSFMRELSSLPYEIGDLTNLKSIHMIYSGIKAIPSSFWQLLHLEKIVYKLDPRKDDLKLGDLKFSGLESWIRLQNSIRLKLSTAIDSFAIPQEIWNLVRFKRLDLSRICIRSLPSSIGNLVQLRALVLNDSPITSLPDCLVRLKKLFFLGTYWRDFDPRASTGKWFQRVSVVNSTRAPVDGAPRNNKDEGSRKIWESFVCTGTQPGQDSNKVLVHTLGLPYSKCQPMGACVLERTTCIWWHEDTSWLWWQGDIWYNVWIFLQRKAKDLCFKGGCYLPATTG